MPTYRESVARWIRMLTIAGDESLSKDERARLIGQVNGPVQLSVALTSYRWPWQRAVAHEVMDAAGHAALAALNEHLNPALETTQYLLEQLSEATKRPREQLVQEMAIALDQAIEAAEDPPTAP